MTDRFSRFALRATTTAAAGVFALVLSACATANVPEGLPSSIDQINTGQASSPIRVGEAVQPAATRASAQLGNSTTRQINSSETDWALPRETRSSRTNAQGLFGGGGGGTSTGLSVFVSQTRFSATASSAIAGSSATGPIGADFRDATGYGAAFNLAIGHSTSLELGASWVDPKVTFTSANGSSFNGDNVRMVPITGTLQLHFIPGGTVDPYVGAGATYVTFQDAGNFRVNNGLESVNFSSEVGPLVNAGINMGFARSLGLMVDAKYMWLHPKGTTTFTGGLPGSVGGGGNFNLNPLIISAGVRLGF